MDNKEIVRRFDLLYAERQGSVDQTWDLVERFVLPLRGEFYVSLNSENEVDWRRREVYDSTAVFAAQSLAASMQSNLTSASQRWFELRFRNDDLNTQKVAMEWLETCTNLIYMALQESNFEIEVAEAYLDLVGYGTCLLTEELDDTGELVFAANPLRDTVFEQDHRKQVATVFRKLSWTPTQMISKFGEDGVPDEIREKAEKPEGSTDREDVIFCVYTRKGKDGEAPLAPKERPFGYKYVLKTGHETLGEEGGYYEMPCYVARWKTVAGSKWGKSPAIDSMGDILTLNQLKEATLEAASKVIDPPQKTEDGALVGDLDLDRGGLTVLTDINGIAPLMTGTQFDVSNLEVQWLTESIRNHFYQNQLELKESPAMTATEVNVRYELMQRMMGPTLGRLKNDLLDPMIQRTFNILYRENRLPQLPEGLEAGRLDIQYTGPMPRAQQGNTANEIVRWLGEIAQLAQIYPQARDIPDVDEAIRMIGELRGVPAKAMNSEQEVQVGRQQRAQQQAAMEQMAQAQAAGETMQSVGKGMQELQ